MGKIRRGSCGEGGPYNTHCTEHPTHQYSCYDAGEDVSFNHRQDFEHHCDDTTCPRRDFVNTGD